MVLVFAFEVAAKDRVVLFIISVVVVSMLFVFGYIVCVIAEEGKTNTKTDVKLDAIGNVDLVTSVVVVCNDAVDVI